MHAGIAKVSGSDIWELSEAEARHMSESVRDVLMHYDVDIAASNKTKDIIMCGVAAAEIYGPRFYMAVEQARERQAGPAGPPAPAAGPIAPASSIGIGPMQTEPDKQTTPASLAAGASPTMTLDDPPLTLPN